MSRSGNDFGVRELVPALVQPIYWLRCEAPTLATSCCGESGNFRAQRAWLPERQSVSDNFPHSILLILLLLCNITLAEPYTFPQPAHFPPAALPADNPLTTAGIDLGRNLFFDNKLAQNETIACAGCHIPEGAFSDAWQARSVGWIGSLTRRNSPPIFNMAWQTNFFWDGRSHVLREMVVMPIRDFVEMDETLENVMTKLERAEEYPALFEQAFGTPTITSNRIARALEQFMLSLVSIDAKYDRVQRGEAQFTKSELHGQRLFNENGCAHCHTPPLFTNHSIANNGLDTDTYMKDEGRSEITKNSAHQNQFKVPSLRNIKHTPPYMHDGRFYMLDEVLAHYNEPLHAAPNLDQRLKADGMGLNEAELKALTAFLETLSEDSEVFKEETYY